MSCDAAREPSEDETVGRGLSRQLYLYLKSKVIGLSMGCDVLRLAEQRADCAENTKRHVKVLKASIPQT